MAWIILSSGSSHAIMIFGDTADAIVRDGGGVQNTGNAQIRTGQWSAPNNFANVFPFLLPNFGAVATPFSNTAFKFNLNAVDSNPAFTYNADLYGVNGTRAAATVLGTDYYAGATGMDATSTLLETAILTPGSATGVIQSVDISTYLNAQYNSGAGAGEYVFLRLNIDSATVDNVANGYLIASADTGGTANDPMIVPEPSSIWMLAFFGILLFAGTRFRRTCC